MRHTKTRIVRPTSPFDDYEQTAKWDRGFHSGFHGGNLNSAYSIEWQIGYKAGVAYRRTRDQFAAVGGV